MKLRRLVIVLVVAFVAMMTLELAGFGFHPGVTP